MPTQPGPGSTSEEGEPSFPSPDNWQFQKQLLSLVTERGTVKTDGDGALVESHPSYLCDFLSVFKGRLKVPSRGRKEAGNRTINCEVPAQS